MIRVQNQPLYEAYVKQCIQQYGECIASYPLELIRFEKDDILCADQEPMLHLLFVVRGRAKIYKLLENGKRMLFDFYDSEGVLGDLELLTGAHGNSTVEAVTDVDCLGISLRGYQKKILSDPLMLHLMGKQLAKKLDRCSTNSAKNLYLPLESRLAEYILLSEVGGIFRTHLGQLSEQLGVSYRHLLRTLRSFTDNGILENISGSYRILNRNKLENLITEQ